jgi:hypothetical protein
MSQVRDLFFDEFYEELERVVAGIEPEEETPREPSILADEVRRRWVPYAPDPEEREEALVSVDGGVQLSRFAYGGFVTVGRALALIHWPGRDRMTEKRVKIHVQEVYDDRDRGFIPGYVRMIAEYDAARAAAERVLDEGGRPVVLLDGSLYFSRFPYAIREYTHHPGLLAELFTSISALRVLGRDRGFPVAAVTKDSTVFYLHMRLLRDMVRRAGLGMFSEEVERASSPFDLRMRVERLPTERRDALTPFVERRPLCDTALVRATTDTEGYTRPLLLAPSIYYGRGDAPALYDRIRRNLDEARAEKVINALRGFFGCPGVAVTYWKPTRNARPFRVDVSAATLGYDEPWEGRGGNRFVDDGCDLAPLEGVLNHLGYWFCNDVEYNLPLRQADTLARFDRNLYTRKYEPFIVSRLEAAGYDVRGTRRMLREVDG